MNVIEVEHVTKRFRQYRDATSLASRVLRPFDRRRVHHIEALKDLSFSVAKGETLGIIGRNGSGKTTLLRLLSGVSGPTDGRVRVVGSVAPLIGIGVGFNGELTGRENVYVNGRLLGMSAAEIDALFDAIVDFSELAEFLDVPVKFYSSGMFLRLAFSVAVHTTPDIMVVDEILAVGDTGFQAKCDQRLREIRASGATIVIVTHNMPLVERMAARTLLLDEGALVFDGATDEAVGRYVRLLQEDTAPTGAAGLTPSMSADVLVEVVDPNGLPTQQLAMRDPVRLRVRLDFREEVSGVSLAFALDRTGFGRVYATSTDPSAWAHGHGPGRPLEVEIELDEVPLKAGEYNVRMVVRAVGRARALATTAPLHFRVKGRSPGMGLVDFGARFRFNGVLVPNRTAGILDVAEDALRDL